LKRARDKPSEIHEEYRKVVIFFHYKHRVLMSNKYPTNNLYETLFNLTI